MHTDDFYHYLSKGAIPPHLPNSSEQNRIVIEAFLEAAKRYVQGGYDVIVDGIIGPEYGFNYKRKNLRQNKFTLFSIAPSKIVLSPLTLVLLAKNQGKQWFTYTAVSPV